jgi:hypothetical protein
MPTYPRINPSCGVCRAELYSDHFMEFFERVEVANFEIASDAFSSFKVSHQQLCEPPTAV